MKLLNYILLQLIVLFTLPIFGQSNIDCNRATKLNIGLCEAGFMAEKTNHASQGICADSVMQSLWYSYKADQSGIIRIETHSKFNDALSIFSGGCSQLDFINCFDSDEYGFQGEVAHLEVTSGTTYYIELSNIKDEFSLKNDSFCIQLQWSTELPDIPANDLCEDALPLEANGAGFSFSNANATSGIIQANTEFRSRADVWFSFVASDQEMTVDLNGNFSSVITLYSGECDMSNEFYSTGAAHLFMPNLAIGQSYLIQVSGNFATIEGIAKIKLITSDQASNTDCESKTRIALNSPCLPFSNRQLTFSGIQPNCEFGPAADVWYSFIAPPTNGVKIRTEADFLHSLAIYAGNCGELENIFCQSNPQSCQGYTIVENLRSGQEYYLQIMSKTTSYGYNEGAGCLEILNIDQGGSFIPLSLEVTPFCLSINEASLELDIKGGEGNVVVEGNQHGDIISNGSPYLVKVTDDKGCVQLQKGTVACDIMGECEIFYFLSTTPTSCAGDIDGKAFLTSSGNSNITYEWSNGSTASQAANLKSGSHSVTLTNSEGCSFDVLFIIESPPTLITENTIVHASSTTAIDGMVSLIPMGGTAPYSFEWEDGSSDANLNNLIAGSYAYTITDSKGCMIADTAHVSIILACPESQSLSLSVTQNIQECYAALEWITSSSEISNPADITYKAGQKITLSDGFKAMEGATFKATIESCATDMDQDGYFTDTDCDDDNALINPGVSETPYNGIDDDCDPTTLDDDLDQDGFVLADDCDDNDATINPDQIETVYNGVDDDCNPETLDDDLDQDGFVLADDCDDNNATINPNQSENPYNGIDDDCDPTTLDDDLDQDGFVLADDCDDNNATINPDQTETVYNGVDDDCSPETLDDDLDQDGFVLADDCDDTNPDINPDASEIPGNGIDEDCDGIDLITSLEEFNDSEINIFPNPATDYILVEFKKKFSYSISIYDIMGKLHNHQKNNNSIKVADLRQGTYLLVIQDLKSGKKLTKQIMVVR